MTFEDMKKIEQGTTSSSGEKTGIDHLKELGMNMALEDAFGVSIPDEELANMKTVGDIFNYLTAHAEA